VKEKIMRTYLNNEKHEAGFTFLELATIVVILGVLASIAIPTFSIWLPNYRLKSAARDLYSNLQMAKLGAVKQNKEWAVFFNQVSNRYTICSDDGPNDAWNGPGSDDECVRTVNLGDYDDIYFGHASINKGVADELFSGGDHIYYANNWVEFGPVYGIGTRPSGVIHLKKWTGSIWD
jgi:Tfp pilus assembly protein FimT